MFKLACLTLALLLCKTGLAQNPSPADHHWDFEQLDQLNLHGNVHAEESRLTAPVYPLFEAHNQSLKFTAPARVTIPDPGDHSKLDFDNGDEVTFEAWVRLDRMNENIYLIGKGRTELQGPHSVDQNWAFRLRKNGGAACVNLLFRSADSKQQKGDWHRWTSNIGITAGARWHHVALKYRFGEPESIVAFVNGKSTNGKWDMGGPTTNAPVVNNEDVWIGSSMGGNVGNSLTGAIDDLKIYRRLLPDAELLSHYAFQPPDMTPKSIPSDHVLVQLIPAASYKTFDPEIEPPLIEWKQPELAFHQLPQVYDDWGIRRDVGSTLLIRAWSMVMLPKGKHQILIRGRGLSRLTIGKHEVASLGPVRRKGGAHNHVIDLPETVHPEMRPHAMNEQEQVVEYSSDGTAQRWLFETVVGGPSYRPEFGETCVAVAKPADMFRIVSASTEFPLTDEGWSNFRNSHRRLVQQFNSKQRATANQQKQPFWQTRHDWAKQNLLSSQQPSSIDHVIQKSVARWNHQANEKSSASPPPSVFQDQIQPLLQSACGRCHGQKESGNLNVFDRSRLLAGGESGEAAIVPGHPEKSYLFELIAADKDDYRMPPKGDGLNPEQVERIRTWIRDGAKMLVVAKGAVDIPEDVSDLTFLRRVYLDTVGVIPTVEEIRWFESQDPTTRRQLIVDRLLQDPRWADHWVSYWQDVLAENPNLLKPMLNNTGPFRFWIHEALADNKPLDRFATELILMRGSQWRGGSAGFAVASQNDSPMAAKAHVISSAFLGINMKCARCHDAPYHDHSQADLFQMAAMLKKQPIKLPQTSTVPAAFFEKQEREPLIEATLKAGDVVNPRFPFHDLLADSENVIESPPGDLRQQLAHSVTGSRRFAEVMANRIWQRLMGAGLVEPIDDWEANPASNPELLNLLADLLIQNDYDARKFVRKVLLSEAYQRQAVDRTPNSPRLFAAPFRRRMTAEQVVDSAYVAAGRSMTTEELTMDIEGLLPGNLFLNFGFPQRAWEFTTLANERDRPSLALPRAQPIVDVLTAFGWRDSRPEPLTERPTTPNVIQPGVLANGSLAILLTRISDDTTLLPVLQNVESVDELTEQLYLTFLTRYPTRSERADFRELLQAGFDERVIPVGERTAVEKDRRHRYVSWSNHLHTDANVIKAEIQDEVRRGPIPTNQLTNDWRERSEDALWVLLNAPEMVMVP